MLAAQPGLGHFVAARVAKSAGKRPRVEADGRSDLVIVTTPEPPDADALDAEDLFVLLTEGASKQSATATAAHLFDPTRWQVGLDRARGLGVRISATTTFRVIARVRSEQNFKRTELRDAVVAQVRRWRPRWRLGDPAALELWVLETKPGRFRLAARVSSPSMRQREGRPVERRGSLRPTVAAAMVAAAGPARGTLVDPFCGSGTILAEATRAGWQPFGSDIDPEAVSAATQNVPAATITCQDATSLPVGDHSVQAIVTNPPFGKQHQPRTGGLPEREWWSNVLRELVRIAEPNAPIVLLHPGDGEYRDAVKRSGLHALPITTVTTLGQRATVWRLRISARRRTGGAQRSGPRRSTSRSDG